jgi:hypothetical protein
MLLCVMRLLTSETKIGVSFEPMEIKGSNKLCFTQNSNGNKMQVIKIAYY